MTILCEPRPFPSYFCHRAQLFQPTHLQSVPLHNTVRTRHSLEPPGAQVSCDLGSMKGPRGNGFQEEIILLIVCAATRRWEWQPVKCNPVIGCWILATVRALSALILIVCGATPDTRFSGGSCLECIMILRGHTPANFSIAIGYSLGGSTD